MIQDYTVDIGEFLSLTNAGLKAATFVQIKEALIKRYKEVYGSDIDLSTGTADGVFINNLSLIMNNILRTVETMYANLDVNFASGEYLDILCRLSNVIRKQETRSRASIKVRNLSSAPITLSGVLSFFDRAGIEWLSVESLPDTELQFNEDLSLTVECTKLGPISAPAGYIYQMTDATLDVYVEQEYPATIGQSEESDSDLRERRAQSNGAQGLTVLESLYGALRQISGIADVKIYNNDSGSNSDDPKDSTVISGHSIYVILRKEEDVIVENSTIGSLIYEKLTPGVSTTQFTGASNGLSEFYQYVPTIIDSSLELFSKVVYWKKCVPISPEFSITVRIEEYFDYDKNNTRSWSTSGTFALIGQALIKYMSTVRIGYTPRPFDLQSAAQNADPLFKGRPTFYVAAADTLAQNPDTYYEYSTISVDRVNTDNPLDQDRLFKITLSKGN